MKIATWNVARRRAWEGALEEESFPDVMLLQEVLNPSSLELPGLFVLGKEINERGRKESWGNAIVSKYPLELVTLKSEYEGSLLAAVVSKPDGQRLGVINLYGLLEPSPLRAETKIVHFGLHRMLSDSGFWLAGLEEPIVDGFVVAGDLNKDRAMDGGTGFKSGRNIASNVLNRFDDYGLIELQGEGDKTFRHSSSKSMWKIDHLFVSEKMAGRATAIDLTALNPDFTNSDHMPLGVELSASLTA